MHRAFTTFPILSSLLPGYRGTMHVVFVLPSGSYRSLVDQELLAIDGTFSLCPFRSAGIPESKNETRVFFRKTKRRREKKYGLVKKNVLYFSMI